MKGMLKKMRVLMLGPARSVNGGVSAVVNNYYSAGLDKKIDLQYIGTMEDGGKIHKLFVAVKALGKFIVKVFWCEVVHIHMASDVSIYRKTPFIWLTKVFGKKLVIQQHGGNIQQFYYSECGKGKQKFIQKTLRKADAFLVVAPYLKDIFKDIVEEEKIEILTNAIEIPKEAEQDYSKQKLLFLGRLCKEKGIGELLEAVQDLKKEFQRLELFLGGVWVDEELKKKAEECGDFVHYLGWIDAKKKDEYLRYCNIFVLPTYFEGLPMSLLEGMAYGCACVACEVGGIPQLMTDRKDGLLIPAKEVQELKGALRELLQDQNLQKELGESARKRIEENYEISKRVDRLTEIYRKICRLQE